LPPLGRARNSCGRGSGRSHLPSGRPPPSRGAVWGAGEYHEGGRALSGLHRPMAGPRSGVAAAGRWGAASIG